MKQRNLLECTIDTTQPFTELGAVISEVLNTLPDAETRVSILQALSDQITTALLAIEDGEAEAYDTV